MSLGCPHPDHPHPPGQQPAPKDPMLGLDRLGHPAPPLEQFPHSPSPNSTFSNPARRVVLLLPKLPDSPAARSHPALPPLAQVQALVVPPPDYTAQRIQQSQSHQEETSYGRQYPPRQTLEARLLQGNQKSQRPVLVRLPGQNYPSEYIDGQTVRGPPQDPSFPTLPGADSPTAINTALLEHFFPLKPPLPARGRLSPHLRAIPPLP